MNQNNILVFFSLRFMYLFYVLISVYVWASALGGERRASDLLELELQKVVSHSV